MKKVLVTGGLGYIGSHTVVELLEKKYKVYILDSLINSNLEVLDNIQKIVGKILSNNLFFYKINLLNINILKKKCKEIGEIDFCIHFASLKSVGESVTNPILYYNNNLVSTLNLLKSLELCNCNKLVFSSSATVYGDSKSPLVEDSNIGNGITNPYGQTKFMIEQILKDYTKSRENFSVISLRYFNPIGNHSSGLIRDNPKGIPNNLMPYIQQVLTGERDFLTVFGNDYNTHDGSGVRDYIHVTDLSKGHIMALKKIEKEENNYSVYNLGTGKGYSVLDLVKEMEKVSGRKIPLKIGDRRPGDLDIVFCNPEKAKKILQWGADKNITDMCSDCWNSIKNRQKNDLK